MLVDAVFVDVLLQCQKDMTAGLTRRDVADYHLDHGHTVDRDQRLGQLETGLDEPAAAPGYGEDDVDHGRCPESSKPGVQSREPMDS